MICLDTNYLILSLVAGSAEAAQLAAWSDAGESFYAPAVVWYEFICGPVNDDQIAGIRALLREVQAFDDEQAREAARLFNAAGRRRHLRVAAMIAAAATSRKAPLATGNRRDFEFFVDSGLRLMS
ncbi:MAG: PIN domain-containing protein [Verrucomicrobia bacterium]|nr:PIN domain-containing protein [Verrucomicrobiota bacterium]